MVDDKAVPADVGELVPGLGDVLRPVVDEATPGLLWAALVASEEVCCWLDVPGLVRLIVLGIAEVVLDTGGGSMLMEEIGLGLDISAVVVVSGGGVVENASVPEVELEMLVSANTTSGEYG